MGTIGTNEEKTIRMQHEAEGNENQETAETNKEDNPEEGCANIETVSSSAEVLSAVDKEEQGGDNNLDFIDKSEMSDEDFKSIKTVDDNLNDFEGEVNVKVLRNRCF